MRAHIYLTHPIPNTRSNLQLYESGGPEGVVFCRKASNSFSTGHSLNPRKQYITRLRIGTSIARDRMPGYPALEKIFQAGTMPRPQTINITSSAGKLIERIKSSFRAIRLPHLRLHHSQAACCGSVSGKRRRPHFSKRRPSYIGHHDDQESEIPSVMIPVSLQVGHLPVPPQFGHLSWSELRATFRPVPKHFWQSPVPPQFRQRLPPASPSNIMGS